jgi:hypothetical protein
VRTRLLGRARLTRAPDARPQAIAAYGEINFVIIGVVQQLSALVFEATRLMLVQVLMNSQGYTLNPIQSLYYVSPACLLCLTVPFLVLEFPVMRSSAAWQLRPPVMLANAATAFCLNLAVFLLIGKTSALTMNIAGVIKDWMLIWRARLRALCRLHARLSHTVGLPLTARAPPVGRAG